ncbi:MAG: LysR family transcriptional regulator [Rhodospirillaceae bacterium]|nr:LysR family transcriptional regulator [Rhodospirillaceae bacterium]
MSLTAARMRAFNAVVDEGNYSAAARRLGMSQPAVSQAIQDLEKSFSVKLFERRGRSLVPTHLALELAPISSEIGRLEDAARVLLQRSERLETGVLRVGLGSLMPGMAIIGAFQKRFPNIQVQVEYAIFSDIIDAVMAGRADLGILPDVPKDGRFRTKVCLTQEVVALIPHGHPLASNTTVTLADLMVERLIFQKRGSATQKVVDKAFRTAGLAPHASLVLETGGEVYEAVANGLGVGFLWRHGTSRRDGARRVPVVEIDAPYEEVVFRRADQANPIVDMFFDATDLVTFS